MNITYNVIFAILGTIGYAIYFQLPKRLIAYVGLVGGIGYLVYALLVSRHVDTSTSTMIAAISVAFFGEIFARTTKNPSTMFLIPGILPLTPGYSLYMTMRYLTSDNISVGIAQGIETLSLAGSIAVGIMLVSSFGKISRNIKAKKLKKEKINV